MINTASDRSLRRARIIAIANQKGGVGKTTTAVNLSAGIGERGIDVLLVDLDPQGNASTGIGIELAARRNTSYDLLMRQVEGHDAVVATPVPGVSAIPATIDLAGAEIELIAEVSRESRLGSTLEPLRGGFDVIVIDCPPSLGLLSLNALAAADEVLVPIQCEYYALEGLGQLMRNLRLIRQNVNPSLRLNGIVLTMFDGRTKLAEQVVDEIRAYFGDLVYRSVIPRSVRVSEAPGFGQPITLYDTASGGARAYRDLAVEFLTRTDGGAEFPDGPLGADGSGGVAFARVPSAAVTAPKSAEPHSVSGREDPPTGTGMADAVVGSAGGAMEEGAVLVYQQSRRRRWRWSLRRNRGGTR